jgi:predicted amidophosphoribosyltransferase
MAHAISPTPPLEHGLNSGHWLESRCCCGALMDDKPAICPKCGKPIDPDTMTLWGAGFILTEEGIYHAECYGPLPDMFSV